MSNPKTPLDMAFDEALIDNQVSDWIGSDSEWIGIIADLINGTYTVDELKVDFNQFLRLYDEGE